MNRSVVALVPLDTYTQSAVDAAVRTGVSLLGGIGQFVRPEELILLKPNLLAKAATDRAVTTHHAVFSAVATLLQQEGYTHLAYGDSPGNPATTPLKAAQACGIAAAAEAHAIPMADFDNGSPVARADGRVSRSFTICEGVKAADALINLCKMKTHALERITGAVKNLYGCVYSVNKAAGHAKHPTAASFAHMLCDLYPLTKARLHIMDGVIAMEGNGPASGTPTPMNVLLFSADPVALDSVFAALVALDPALVPTCVSGAEAGIGVYDHDSITIRTPEGDVTVQQAFERYGNGQFNVHRSGQSNIILSKLKPLLPLMEDRPHADKKRCIACGICEEACPVEGKAVHAGYGHKAHYDYSRCIRCYCCQEMCPAKAITVRRPLISRICKH